MRRRLWLAVSLLWLAVSLLWLAAAAVEGGERGQSAERGDGSDQRGKEQGPLTSAQLPVPGRKQRSVSPQSEAASPAVPALGRLTVRECLRAEFSAWCPGKPGAPCQRCTGYWSGGVLVKPASGVTAQGRRPVVGKVTTCPSWLELGTRVRIVVPGWGSLVRTCLDRGPEAAPDGVWQFDVLVETHEAALAAFGGRGRTRGVVEVLNGR